ncbi:MAG: hypothetical protein ACOC8C_00415 [Chloroflexota bacterium]
MSRDIHLYLSLTPEALIVSMLTPEEFGVYYAVGTAKKAHGQAIFLEVDPGFRHDYFRIQEGIQRCVPHENGSPKASIYVSVYRVLEHVPLDVLGDLFLSTADGRVLGLEATDGPPEPVSGLHLYQEIAPVHPLVVSSLGPEPFYQLIVKTPSILLRLPAISFAELRLGELAQDPEHGEVGDLPYSRIEHLRHCLLDLGKKTVDAKMVNRTAPATFAYRTIKSGIFLGNRDGLLFFRFPSAAQLRADHYRWFRSAWSA